MEDCFTVEAILEKLRRDRAELAMALEEVKGRVRQAVMALLPPHTGTYADPARLAQDYGAAVTEALRILKGDE